MPASRRYVICTLASGLPAVLTGCVGGTNPANEPVTSPRTVPPETTKPPASRTPTPTSTPELPTADDFELDVGVVQGFTQAHPARLEISFTNTGELPLVGQDGPRYVLPFVDDDYAGEAADGSLALFLVPNDAWLAVEPEGSNGGKVEEFLPTSPTDGCWSIPFDWPDAKASFTAILNGVRLAPGETVRHGYTLYYIDECVTGTFTFENRLDLRYGSAGTPPGPAYPTAVGFDLIIAADETISVDVHEPSIDTPAPEY